MILFGILYLFPSLGLVSKKHSSKSRIYELLPSDMLPWPWPLILPKYAVAFLSISP